MPSIYKLDVCAGLHTLITTTKDNQPIAALPLSVTSEDSNSPSSCEIDIRSGVFHATDRTKFFKDSTLIEIQDHAYRLKVWKNLERFQLLNCRPGVGHGLQDLMQEWMRLCDETLLRVPFGGDFANRMQLQCVINAAATVPDKRVYIRTRNIEILNDMFLDNILTETLLPPNVLLFAEPAGYDDLYLADMPRCTFVHDEDAEDDLTFFPDKPTANIRMRISATSDAYMINKAPWWFPTEKQSTK